MVPFKILDGAMGSELIRKGLILPEHTWSADANINNPAMVRKIHSEYVDAGADFITTNTFRTTHRAYLKTGINERESINIAKDSLLRAVAIAQSAADNSIMVVGSIAPLEDCYSPELFPGSNTAADEFHILGKWLVGAGVDILLLETMNSIAETEAALIGIENFGLPIWISFVLKDDRHLFSGESIARAIETVKDYSVDCVMLNCNPLDRTVKAVESLIKHWPHRWGVYPNLGVGEPSPDGYVQHCEKMDCFLSAMENIIKLGPSIMGTCCGSSAHHISNLFELRKQYGFVAGI